MTDASLLVDGIRRKQPIGPQGRGCKSMLCKDPPGGQEIAQAASAAQRNLVLSAEIYKIRSMTTSLTAENQVIISLFPIFDTLDFIV